jgi:5-deoxy-glucuronate isomerase
MGLLFKIPPGKGHLPVFGPGEHSIRWLGLEILRLEAGEDWREDLDNEEAVLVILSGSCSVSVESEETVKWERLGRRRDVFDGLPTAVYVPRRSRLEVTGENKLELAIIKAPCEASLSPTVITPGDAQPVSVGIMNWQRDVRPIIPPGSPVSQHLIVGETLNPPGNWSGFPPHKHEEISDRENLLEEFYLFKTKPSDGYAVQLVYRDSGEQPLRSNSGQGYIVSNDDVIVFPNSYHPTVAAPGTTVYYLWALSGKSKAYDVTIDPRFSWAASAQADFNEKQHH